MISYQYEFNTICSKENFTIKLVDAYFKSENENRFSELQLNRIKTLSNKEEAIIDIESDAFAGVILSLGKNPKKKSITSILRYYFYNHAEELQEAICIDLSSLDANNLDTIIGAIVHGIELSTYKIKDWSRNLTKNKEIKVVFYVPTNTDDYKVLIDSNIKLAKAQKTIMHLVDMPSNFKTPQFIRDRCIDLSKEYGFKTTFIEGDDVLKSGLHAVHQVSRASICPPVFAVLEYRSGKKDAKHIGLVGKGVTFDTGGISIKPSASMGLMKSDMGGAAAVLGAFLAAIDMKIDVDITVVMPLVENAIDADAVKPGDVISSLSGKTIEVTDTDAEGRLILADGLYYIKKNYNLDCIVDLATLTGSTVRTFGYECAAIFSNDDNLSSAVIASGNATGERCWNMPLWSEYEVNLKSDVADISNYSGKPICGAIDAAIFLKEFIDEHPSWAHIDIAGVAFQSSKYGTQKSSTGYGVELLLDFIRKYA